MAEDRKKPLSAEEEKRVADMLTRSKVQMLMSFPFFGILTTYLALEINYDIDTAGTDGTKFYYNPNFIKGLTEAERNWVVVHEVLHPALKHLWRRGDRQHKQWNCACDYALHDIMTQFIEATKYEHRDKLKMPKGCLYDIKYKDMSAEEIYDAMPRQEDGDQGQQTLDDHSKWEQKPENGSGDGGSQSRQAQAQEWEGRMISAAKSAESKLAGNLPAFLKRMLGKLTSPQKNWRVLLAEFIEPEFADYGFNPPDRRFSDSDFILPDLTETDDTVKKILFWVDTSGSIGDKELAVVYSEIVGAMGQFQGKLSGWIGFFDHEAYPPVTFESVEDVLAARPEGGGGTSFHAPFEYATSKMESDEIAGIIMLTDGYAEWPKENITQGIPVLWLINNEQITPPWGLHTTVKV